VTTGNVGKPVEILLIEDNPGDVRLIQEMLAGSGQDRYQLECTDRLSKGLECLVKGGIDVVLLDLSLPDSQGLDTFDKVQAQAPAVPLVLLTGADDKMLAVQAVRQGAQDYLVKGDIDSTVLGHAMRYAVERNRVVQELRESEERYRLLADNVTDIIWTSGIDLTLTYVSLSVTRILGYSTEEVIGKKVDAFLTPASFEVATKVLAEELAIESMEQKDLFRSRMLELELNCRYGSTIWAEMMMSFLRDPDDRAVGILGVARDITARKRAEDALQESRASLHNIIHGSADGIVIVDRQGIVRFVNPAAESLFGRKADELVHASFGFPIVAGDTTELDIVRQDGEMAVAEMRVTETRWDGESACLASLRDITERKRVEEALRASEEKLRNLFDSASDGIFTIDLNGVYTEVNERMLEMQGLSSKDEILGKNAFEFVAPRDIDRAMVDMQRTLQQWSVARLEYSILRTDGSEFPAEISGTALKDDYGNPVGFIGISRDITERKQIEEMKSDFVSLVSHQLKTPVLGIKAGIENMLEGLAGDLTTEQKQYLQDMYDICVRNYRLVTNLLNISVIERGVLSLDIKPVKLREIVDLAVQNYRKSIEEKGLALNLEETDETVIVRADRDKTVEALSNVINNAVKFTDTGSITIKITREGKCGIVEVRDTGEGISDNVLNTLFTKEKVLSGTQCTGGSAGLGLYIAKAFMKVQEGDITATSVVGEGSTFVLKILRERRKIHVHH